MMRYEALFSVDIFRFDPVCQVEEKLSFRSTPKMWCSIVGKCQDILGSDEAYVRANDYYELILKIVYVINA